MSPKNSPSEATETVASVRPARVGICWNDYEMFWWDATNDPSCPVCSVDDEGYDEQHGFYAPEPRTSGDSKEVKP